MLEWMENMIKDLKEKDYWEKHHNHSPLAKFAIELCIKETELGELDVTEKDVIDNDGISISFAFLWILHRAKEEGFEFDYMNDSLSFIDDWDIIHIAASYGSAYSRKYDNSDRIYALKSDVNHEYDLNTTEHIDAVVALVTGDPLIGNSCIPACELAIKVHDSVYGCRISDIEPMIYENYNRILDKVIYNFDDDDVENRLKLNEIKFLLYKIAKYEVSDAFNEICRRYKGLPKYMMIYLYVLLNNYMTNCDKSEVCMNLITGDIDKIPYDELEKIAASVNSYIDD